MVDQERLQRDIRTVRIMADIMDSITQLGVEVVLAATVGAGLAVWVVGAVAPVRAAIIILINSSGKYSRNTNNN